MPILGIENTGFEYEDEEEESEESESEELVESDSTWGEMGVRGGRWVYVGGDGCTWGRWVYVGGGGGGGGVYWCMSEKRGSWVYSRGDGLSTLNGCNTSNIGSTSTNNVNV